ncbi:MAG: hypothetical protein LBS98_06245 [Coriobacteriales bacterium]|jgi:hypothetical protein|nr:hypothetical protein [Coriobacteriales bacterium]
MLSRKYQATYIIVLSLFVSLVFSVLVPVCTGGVVTLEGSGVLFVIAFVVSLLGSFLVPLGKMAAGFASLLNQSPDTGLGRILVNVFSGTFLTLLIGLVAIAFQTGIGEVDGVNYVTRWLRAFVVLQPVAAIVNNFFDPLATIVTRKLVKEQTMGNPALLCTASSHSTGSGTEPAGCPQSLR